MKVTYLYSLDTPVLTVLREHGAHSASHHIKRRICGREEFSVVGARGNKAARRAIKLMWTPSPLDGVFWLPKNPTAVKELMQKHPVALDHLGHAFRRAYGIEKRRERLGINEL
jgi:hypothetical protein